MKREEQDRVIKEIIRQKVGKCKSPVRLHYVFYEKNMRRDHDNVSGFAHKVIQDALVKAGIIENDGWKDITGYTDDFILDRKNPRIEVTIEEN